MFRYKHTQYAWQAYRRRETKVEYLKFRIEVARSSLGKYGTPVSGASRPQSQAIETRVLDEIRFDSISHWMVPAVKLNMCAISKKNSAQMRKMLFHVLQHVFYCVLRFVFRYFLIKFFSHKLSRFISN